MPHYRHLIGPTKAVIEIAVFNGERRRCGSRTLCGESSGAETSRRKSPSRPKLEIGLVDEETKEERFLKRPHYVPHEYTIGRGSRSQRAGIEREIDGVAGCLY